MYFASACRRSNIIPMQCQKHMNKKKLTFHSNSFYHFNFHSFSLQLTHQYNVHSTKAVPALISSAEGGTQSVFLRARNKRAELSLDSEWSYSKKAWNTLGQVLDAEGEEKMRWLHGFHACYWEEKGLSVIVLCPHIYLHENTHSTPLLSCPLPSPLSLCFLFTRGAAIFVRLVPETFLNVVLCLGAVVQYLWDASERKYQH